MSTNEHYDETDWDYLVSVNPMLHERLVKLINVLMQSPKKTSKIEILSKRDGYSVRNMVFIFKSKYGDKYITICGGTGGNMFNFRYYDYIGDDVELIFETYVYKKTDRKPLFIQKKLNGNIINNCICEIEDYIKYEY